MILGGAATLLGAFIAWRACSADATKPTADEKEAKAAVAETETSGPTT
jgi:hypothetical protein